MTKRMPTTNRLAPLKHRQGLSFWVRLWDPATGRLLWRIYRRAHLDAKVHYWSFEPPAYQTIAHDRVGVALMLRRIRRLLKDEVARG